MPAPGETGDGPPQEQPGTGSGRTTGTVTQMAGATSVTGVAAAESSQGGGNFRDRDPPPSYDGENPEATFVIFEKNVRLWEYETDIPAAKRGVKLLRALSGSARLACEEMTFEEIACDKGVQNVMDKLRSYYAPHLEVSLPRAFEAAVYGPVKQSKEGFSEYIARCD